MTQITQIGECDTSAAGAAPWGAKSDRALAPAARSIVLISGAHCALTRLNDKKINFLTGRPRAIEAFEETVERTCLDCQKEPKRAGSGHGSIQGDTGRPHTVGNGLRAVPGLAGRLEAERHGVRSLQCYLTGQRIEPCPEVGQNRAKVRRTGPKLARTGQPLIANRQPPQECQAMVFAVFCACEQRPMTKAISVSSGGKGPQNGKQISFWASLGKNPPSVACLEADFPARNTSPMNFA